MCTNIHALVNTVVLTQGSRPTGLCGHGKTMARAGVHSLLIVHTVPMGRMFGISPPDL